MLWDTIKAGFPHILVSLIVNIFSISLARKQMSLRAKLPYDGLKTGTLIWRVNRWHFNSFILLNEQRCCVSEGEVRCCLCLGHVCGQLCREDGPLDHHRPQRGHDAGSTHQWRQPCGPKGIVAAECWNWTKRFLLYFIHWTKNVFFSPSV